MWSVQEARKSCTSYIGLLLALLVHTQVWKTWRVLLIEIAVIKDAFTSRLAQKLMFVLPIVNCRFTTKAGVGRSSRTGRRAAQPTRELPPSCHLIMPCLLVPARHHLAWMHIWPNLYTFIWSRLALSDLLHPESQNPVATSKVQSCGCKVASSS